MAQTLPQDHIRAIDQLRMRLSGLSTSIGLLLADLQKPQNDPLVSWPELQKASVNLGQNLEGLANALSAQRQLFTSLHLHPMPNFPGHVQEGLLQQLVRKKLDPKAEAWIDESVTVSKENDNGGSAGLKDEDLRDLWSSAKSIQQEIFARLTEDQVWDDDFTIQERENGVKNVVTGLKRDLDEDEDEDENEDRGDDAMDEDTVKPDEEHPPAVGGVNTSLPPLPLDSMLKFTHGQDVP
ncbi:hypothetical protein Slin14017_G020900 [Septoria linicola]|nr:hypothetical protein Slin14017_G020900 [Septoria linicola]